MTCYGLQTLEKLVNNEDIAPPATSDTKLAELAQLFDPVETQTVKENHGELRIPRTWDSASAHDVGKRVISQFEDKGASQRSRAVILSSADTPPDTPQSRLQ